MSKIILRNVVQICQRIYYRFVIILTSPFLCKIMVKMECGNVRFMHICKIIWRYAALQLDVKEAPEIPMEHPQWDISDKETAEDVDAADEHSEFTTDEDISDNE